MLWVGSASLLCPSFPISCVLFVRLACGHHRPRCPGSWGILSCPVRGSCCPCGSSGVLCSSDCGSLLSLVLLPSTLSRLFHVPCPSGSGVRLPCLQHREFLPASVRGLSAVDDLFTCGACGFSLSGGGRYHLLQAPRSLFSLRSPQYIVAVASRSSSTSSSFLGHLGSPPRSPLRSPLRVAVHHPLLPLALLSGCGFTLPLPLQPCCLLAHRMAGFEVVSLAWPFFLLSVIGFSYSWSLLVVRLHALGTFPLAVSLVTHSSLTFPIALGEFSFFSS